MHLHVNNLDCMISCVVFRTVANNLYTFYTWRTQILKQANNVKTLLWRVQNVYVGKCRIGNIIMLEENNGKIITLNIWHRQFRIGTRDL